MGKKIVKVIKISTKTDAHEIDEWKCQNCEHISCSYETPKFCQNCGCKLQTTKFKLYHIRIYAGDNSPNKKWIEENVVEEKECWYYRWVENTSSERVASFRWELHVLSPNSYEEAIEFAKKISKENGYINDPLLKEQAERYGKKHNLVY